MKSTKTYTLEADAPVHIPDLGVYVGGLHGSVTLSREDVARSLPLKTLLKLGHVRLVADTKPARPQVPVKIRPPPPQKPYRPIVNSERDTEEIILRILERVPTPMTAEELGKVVEQAILRAFQQIPQTSQHMPAPQGQSPARRSPVSVVEEPVFIPSGIVRTQTETLQVQSESAQSEGVADAASALKSLRKKGKS